MAKVAFKLRSDSLIEPASKSVALFSFASLSIPSADQPVSLQKLSAIEVPLLAHRPSSELDSALSALYPYLSSEPLPWTLGCSSAFRVRRLGGWQKLDSLNSSPEEAGTPSLSGYGAFLTSSR